MPERPSETRWVIVGAGFAGASTAWALGSAGLGPGVILEQESVYGFHASGRNAALLYLVESDPIVLDLALRSYGRLRELDPAGTLFVRQAGGLTVAGLGSVGEFERLQGMFREHGLDTTLFPAAQARARFPILANVEFGIAMWCAAEAVVDIHALLTRYLQLAREAGFVLLTSTRAENLVVEGGRVVGVETARGRVGADVVIDASGAWAGRLGREDAPLPLQPKRRHLFVTGPPPGGHLDSPFVWVDDAGFYFRPEGDGLLFSPCDETPLPPGDPPVDPAAAELLAVKLAEHAPSFVNLPVRRSWACLRTFVADRRPLIGFDPDLPGLFHVSALGGFGMGTSAAVGNLAATLLSGRSADRIEAAAVSPGRPTVWRSA